MKIDERGSTPASAGNMKEGGGVDDRARQATARKAGIAAPLLLVLVCISTIGPIALNGVLPATSAVMRDFETSYGLAQLVLTVYLFATLVSQIVLGPAADRHGRRPVMIGSLLVFAVGSVGCAVAPSVELLLVARFVQGFGGAVCMFLPRTIVRDVYPRDRAASVIGYMTTAMMIAPMFGPAVGGWVTDAASWRYLYWGLAVFGIALAVLAYRFQYETMPADEDANAGSPSLTVTASSPVPTGRRAASSPDAVGGSVANALHRTNANERAPFAVLLRERAFVAYALLMTGSVGVYYTFLAGAPWVAMESRGLDASTYGIWFAMVAIGYLTGNLIAGRFSERFGGGRMILFGLLPFLIGVFAFWAMAGWQHPFGLFLPMQLVALSNGMCLPNMISGAMSVRPSLAATASGLAGGLQTAFGVLLTLAVGALLPSGDLWLNALATLCAVVTLTGLWVGQGAEGAPQISAALR